MKKLLLTCLSVLAALTAYGQGGQVSFNNTAATLFTTNGPGGSPSGQMRGLNAYRIGLYTAPAGTTTESLFTLTAMATNSSLLGGRIAGVFVDTANGNPIAYQVRAWSLAGGATYEAAKLAQATQAGIYLGQSLIGGVTPATGGAPPPVLFTSTAGVAEFPGQLTSGIVLTTIPEPSSIALGLLGLGAIALFRRRK